MKNKRILTWALELEEFDYIINHIASHKNQISDCLSRINGVTNNSQIFPQMSVDEFILAQNKDGDINAALEYVKNPKIPTRKLGTLKRFRKMISVSNTGVVLWKGRIIIPRSLRHNIMELCHDNPMAGHFAVDRTIENFKYKYFWPSAIHDVENWVRSCKKCNEFNTPSKGYLVLTYNR